MLDAQCSLWATESSAQTNRPKAAKNRAWL